MVLEHVDDPVTLLRKAKSWIAVNGEIHLLVPNARSMHRMHGVALGYLSLCDDLSDSDVRLGHLRVYRRELIEEHIEKAGLAVRERLPTYIKHLPNAAMVDYNEKQYRSLFKLAEMMDIEYSAHLYYVLGR